ncbi:hypothetical protein EK904_010454, partial [Melospiza melodia maxima]
AQGKTLLIPCVYLVQHSKECSCPFGFNPAVVPWDLILLLPPLQEPFLHIFPEHEFCVTTIRIKWIPSSGILDGLLIVPPLHLPCRALWGSFWGERRERNENKLSVSN